MRGMLALLAAGTVVLGTWTAVAQSSRSLIREGNAQYKDEKYPDAEVSYRKALEKDSALVPGHYNLGNTLHKQGKFDESVKEYESSIGRMERKNDRADALYNIGNSYMREQKYEDAVKSYIEALKVAPKDDDAKYNLSYALAKLRQQQQQQQQNKKQDKNKDNQQDRKNQDKQDQKKNQQNQDQQQNKQQPQQQQKQMSKAEAERILTVLKNSEKDVQRRLRVRQSVRPKSDKDW